MEVTRTQVYHIFDPQPIRVLDVIFVAPLMIYAGVEGKFYPFIKWSLIGVGFATMIYNGINYHKNYREEDGL